MFNLGFPTSDKKADEAKAAAPNKPKNYKRSRKRRNAKSRKKTQVEPLATGNSKKHHDAPMTKSDIYFALDCEMVGVGLDGYDSAVARVTIVNWDNQVVLDTFVQVPVPVTDYRTHVSGITAQDVESPQAMSFEQVREAVQNILRGKILIGHGLENDLCALGLTHPWCDVRDTACYAPYMRETIDPHTGKIILCPRKLRDVTWNVLGRQIQHEGKAHSPLEDAIASLDLYKASRKEWEQQLGQQQREKAEAEKRKTAFFFRSDAVVYEQPQAHLMPPDAQMQFAGAYPMQGYSMTYTPPITTRAPPPPPPSEPQEEQPQPTPQQNSSGWFGPFFKRPKSPPTTEEEQQPQDNPEEECESHAATIGQEDENPQVSEEESLPSFSEPSFNGTDTVPPEYPAEQPPQEPQQQQQPSSGGWFRFDPFFKRPKSPSTTPEEANEVNETQVEDDTPPPAQEQPEEPAVVQFTDSNLSDVAALSFVEYAPPPPPPPRPTSPVSWFRFGFPGKKSQQYEIKHCDTQVTEMTEPLPDIQCLTLESMSSATLEHQRSGGLPFYSKSSIWGQAS